MNPNHSLHRAALCLLCLLCFLAESLRAQDVLPCCVLPDAAGEDCDTLALFAERTDTLPVPALEFPAAFGRVGENVLTDSVGILNPFWEKIRQQCLGLSDDTLHIVHVGDSHVRGRYFPRAAGEALAQAFKAVKYTDVGVNGAFCVSFTRPDRVARVRALHPDLLILSFGTNESHNTRYNSMLHLRQMGQLVRLLRDCLPGVPLLMTTPPGSYVRSGRRGRSRTYRVNPRTETVVNTIRRFADAQGVALWDVYHILGGRERACANWLEAGLMRPDRIHFRKEAYVWQGKLLSQALLKAYNDYVEYVSTSAAH